MGQSRIIREQYYKSVGEARLVRDKDVHTKLHTQQMFSFVFGLLYAVSQ